MQYSEKTFEKNGLKMAYFELGEGKPILFLHGWGGTALTYQKNLEFLALKNKVIAPDLPFFGKSGIPKKDWDLLDYADFLDSFLEHLNLEGVKVVGHSLGGGISLILGSKSERVSEIHAINSTGLKNEFSNVGIIFRLWRSTFFGNPLFSKGGFKIAVRSSKYSVLNVFKNFFGLKKLVKTGLNSLTRDYSKYLSKIKIPTTLYWSDKDKLLPKTVAKELQNKIKDSRIKWLTGNHIWVLFKPEKIVV
ncbi:MAG: alpha/beta hydrolase [Patescibacteria group bacterium]|nr:alpha/beta hydrolase [Patescibacteria group bacterium]